MTKPTTTTSCMLSDVLKLAEHGTVEEFARALTLAKLDLDSAMRHHLVYDFDAAKQYLRALVLHQRRDILEWLLDNDEIVNSVVTSLLVYVCEQPSLSFFFWLQKRLTWRFQTESLLQEQFETAMEHGSAEIASYLLRNFPKCRGDRSLKRIHANVGELWRSEYWLAQLNSAYWDRLSHCGALETLIIANDVSNLEYAFENGFVAHGVELYTAYMQNRGSAPGSPPVTVIRNGVTVNVDNSLYLWIKYCVSCLNLALHHGRWKIAKMFIAVLHQVRPDDLPHGTISCFRLKHPENMSEEDMSEMIEWCMNCLRAVWRTRHLVDQTGTWEMLPESKEQLQQQQQHAPPRRISITVCDDQTFAFRGTVDLELDIACRITGAFVAACDFGVPAACDALLADETLGEVITKHLKLADELHFSKVYSKYADLILNRPLRRASTVKVLVEKGMSPLFLRKFTNIAHVYDMHPDWIRWPISDNPCPSPSGDGGETTQLDVNKSDRIVNEKDFDNDVFVAYRRDNGDIFHAEPFVSMSEEAKIHFLKWLGKNLIGTRFALETRYYAEILRHPLVNATNLTDFIPRTEPICLFVLHEIIKRPIIVSSRSIEDIEDIVNVLLKGIPPETDLLPLDGIGITPRFGFGDVETAPCTFARFDEALERLLRTRSTASSFVLVRVVKAHVMRLEAKLKALIDNIAPHAAIAATGSGCNGGDGSVKRNLSSSASPFSVCQGSTATSRPQKPSPSIQEQVNQTSSTAPVAAFASTSTPSSSQVASLSSYTPSQESSTTATAQQLQKTIRHYRSLGAVLAYDVFVLDFGSAQWFLDGLSSIEDRAYQQPPLPQLQKRPYQRIRLGKATTRSEGSEPAKTIALSLPGFEVPVSKTYGSNTKLLHYWRSEFGIAHTPAMYKRLVEAPVFFDPIFPPLSLPSAPMRVSLKDVERKIRMTATAIAGMHSELGCDAPDANSDDENGFCYSLEMLDHVHEWLCEYAEDDGRNKDRFVGTVKVFFSHSSRSNDINALQVTSRDIAVVSMLEAVDAWSNSNSAGSVSTCSQSSYDTACGGL